MKDTPCLSTKKVARNIKVQLTPMSTTRLRGFETWRNWLMPFLNINLRNNKKYEKA
jgi:hypothetical protein